MSIVHYWICCLSQAYESQKLFYWLFEVEHAVIKNQHKFRLFLPDFAPKLNFQLLFLMVRFFYTQFESESVKLLNRVQLFRTPWAVAHQASLSIDFSRREYWGGLSFPSPRQSDMTERLSLHFFRGSSYPGIAPLSPALQVGSLPLSHSLDMCKMMVILHCNQLNFSFVIPLFMGWVGWGGDDCLFLLQRPKFSKNGCCLEKKGEKRK